MGMRPAMTSMPLEGDVQNVPVIQRAAHLCIFFNLLMFFKVGALKGCKRELYTGTNKTMMCQLLIAC